MTETWKALNLQRHTCRLDPVAHNAQDATVEQFFGRWSRWLMRTPITVITIRSVEVEDRSLHGGNQWKLYLTEDGYLKYPLFVWRKPLQRCYFIPDSMRLQAKGAP